MVHPYDFITVGLTLDVAGGLILAKGFMLKRLDDIVRESRTMSGGNAALVRSALFQRSEATIGGALLTAGFAFQLWANFHGGPTANELGWISSAPRFAIAFAAVVVLAGAALKTGHWRANREFRRRFSGERPWNVKPLA